MTKTPAEIYKYDTYKIGASEKWHTLRKNAQRLQYLARTEQSNFLKEIS